MNAAIEKLNKKKFKIVFYCEVMILNLEVILDLDNERELSLLKWYQQTSPDPKEILLLAHSVLTSGISAYYHDYHKNHSSYHINAEIEAREIVLKQNYSDNLSRLESEKDSEIMRLEKEMRLISLEHETQNKIKENNILVLEKLNRDLNTENQNFEIKLTRCKSDIENLITLKMERANFDQVLIHQKERIERDSIIVQQKDMISQLEKLLSDKSGELSIFLDEKNAEENIKNREENIELKNQIEILKSGNFFKGNTGEFELSKYLQCMFDSFTVINRGKTAHSCDIHLIDKDNNMIAFESKWKQSIEKSDLLKFSHDLENLAETEFKIIGGIFVSFCTSNIPGKGKLLFELGPENLPVCYVGYDNLNEFKTYFNNIATMFRNFCLIYKEIDIKSDSNEYVDELNYLFNLLVKNKTRIEEFRINNLTKINKFVADLDNENRGMYNRIEKLLKKNNALKLKSNLSHCEFCNEHFTNKKLLEKHLKHCGK